MLDEPMINTTLAADPTTLRIAVTRDASQLDSIADGWNRLAGDIPFRSWEWCQCWWQHYRDASSQLFVISVLDEDGEIVGLAPWYLSHSARHGSVVQFLGSGEVCSDYLSVLTAPEMAEAVAHRLADWLATEGRQYWNLLDFSGVEQDDPVLEGLWQRLAALGHAVDRRADLSCWRTELPPDWDQFLASLSKSRRERTRAMLRRVVDTGRAVVHHVTDPAELDHAFEILVDLHQKRRKSLSQEGCFSSPRFTAFHRDVMGRLLAAGQLRLLWTELEGRPMAVEYGITGGDVVYYYQGGFDPELADERPGWLSFAVSLKLAVAQGYRSFDFLRGDESYKASWRATARPLIRLRVAGAHTSDRMRLAAWQACVSVKGWARQWVARTKG